MSISKSLPRNSGENPEQVAQQEDGTGLPTPTPDRIGPGVGMDAEGVMGIARPMTVSTSTTRQDLYSRDSPRPKEASDIRAAQREKR